MPKRAGQPALWESNTPHSPRRGGGEQPPLARGEGYVSMFCFILRTGDNQRVCRHFHVVLLTHNSNQHDHEPHVLREAMVVNSLTVAIGESCPNATHVKAKLP